MGGSDEGRVAPAGTSPEVLYALTVINHGGTHEGSVLAAVAAALEALWSHRDKPQWEEWLAGQRGSLARLADEGTYRELAAMTAHAGVLDGSNSVLSWIPMRGYHIPRAVARLSGSSTTLARRHHWGAIPAASGVVVVVDDTGGTERAASHAVSAALQWQLAQPRLTAMAAHMPGRAAVPVIGVGPRRFGRLLADSAQMRAAGQHAFVANADLIRGG